MLIPDANMLIYAFRGEFPQHEKAHAWVREALAGKENIGIAVPVELAFLRLMTKPLGPLPAASWESAWAFVTALTSAPLVRRVHAGQGHSAIFAGLCGAAGKVGDEVTDFYIAALAIEHCATLVSADQDFRQIAGLKWKNPFGPQTVAEP